MQEILSQFRPYAALAILVVLLIWETAKPFFHFPTGKPRLAHGARNIFFGIANSLINSLSFVTLWWWAADFSARHNIGLLHHLSLPIPVATVAGVLLLDLWTYGWHRANHRIHFLWRFHRVHHSDKNMDVTTANRFHIGEIMISALLRIPIILLLGISLTQLVLYSILMFATVQFHHANIAVPEKLDRFLRLFIVTPFMHKVHHSRLQPETDSNYSSLLSIWDRIFRSFRHRENPHEIEMGLDQFSSEDSQRLPGMLKTPFLSDKT